jgi:hypothetical protein
VKGVNAVGLVDDFISDAWKETTSFVGGVYSEAKSWALPFVGPTKMAMDIFSLTQTPEMPKPPTAEVSTEDLVDERKRRAPPGVIFAGRNYHWTGTVAVPQLRGRGGE